VLVDVVLKAAILDVGAIDAVEIGVPSVVAVAEPLSVVAVVVELEVVVEPRIFSVVTVLVEL
jgi:hypothetical protein